MAPPPQVQFATTNPTNGPYVQLDTGNTAPLSFAQLPASAVPPVYVGTGDPRFPFAGGAPQAHPVSRGAEHVNQRTRQAALSGEFVEMIDLLPSSSDSEEIKSYIDDKGNVNIKVAKQKKGITNALKWLEAWSYYELLLGQHYGLKLMVEMIEYRLFIIGLLVKYKLPQVLNYDAKHRQRLASSHSFSYNTLSYDLYITTFDHAALRSTGKCGKCGSFDHNAGDCQYRNSNSQGSEPFRAKTRSDGETCWAFQNGACKLGRKCRRKHICIGCGADEAFFKCSKCTKALGTAKSVPQA